MNGVYFRSSDNAASSMPTKRKTEAPSGAATELGFAAFLDLRDSTYVWNQEPDLAEEALAGLARIVENAAKNWKGRIGNFTGDGFLLLFPAGEYALMVRTGVAHGQYRSLALLARADVAGEAINRARRCETASDAFFASAQIAGSLERQQRVFVTRDVFSLIGDKADYWHSERLP